MRGNWRFHTVRETNVRADLRRSINPFSLGGHGNDWAKVLPKQNERRRLLAQ